VQKEPASGVETGCPAGWRFNDLRDRALCLCIELTGYIRAASQIPIERSVLFESGLFMKMRSNAHAVVL
jgi:hypothetical protein